MKLYVKFPDHLLVLDDAESYQFLKNSPKLEKTEDGVLYRVKEYYYNDPLDKLLFYLSIGEKRYSKIIELLRDVPKNLSMKNVTPNKKMNNDLQEILKLLSLNFDPNSVFDVVKFDINYGIENLLEKKIIEYTNMKERPINEIILLLRFLNNKHRSYAFKLYNLLPSTFSQLTDDNYIEVEDVINNLNYDGYYTLIKHNHTKLAKQLFSEVSTNLTYISFLLIKLRSDGNIKFLDFILSHSQIVDYLVREIKIKRKLLKPYLYLNTNNHLRNIGANYMTKLNEKNKKLLIEMSEKTNDNDWIHSPEYITYKVFRKELENTDRDNYPLISKEKDIVYKSEIPKTLETSTSIAENSEQSLSDSSIENIDFYDEDIKPKVYIKDFDEKCEELIKKIINHDFQYITRKLLASKSLFDCKKVKKTLEIQSNLKYEIENKYTVLQFIYHLLYDDKNYYLKKLNEVKNTDERLREIYNIFSR